MQSNKIKRQETNNKFLIDPSDGTEVRFNEPITYKPFWNATLKKALF